MKKLVMIAVAAVFSMSAAAYACDGLKHAKDKSDKQGEVAKKEQKVEKKADKKS